MKYILLFLSVFIFCCATCKKNTKTSGCLENKITDFQKEACPNGASVKEYTFQEKTVYVFNHGSCGADRTTEVMDIHCKSLGLLGGIAGVTKINGEEFSKAVFVKTVWEKTATDKN